MSCNSANTFAFCYKIGQQRLRMCKIHDCWKSRWAEPCIVLNYEAQKMIFRDEDRSRRADCPRARPINRWFFVAKFCLQCKSGNYARKWSNSRWWTTHSFRRVDKDGITNLNVVLVNCFPISWSWYCFRPIVLVTHPQTWKDFVMIS